MKNSKGSDFLVSQLGDICEKQSAIILGIGKLLSALSQSQDVEVNSKTSSSEDADDSIEKFEASEEQPTVKRRGRPAKASIVVEPVKKRGRPAKVSSENVKPVKDDINSMKFSDVLLHIAKLSNKPMKVAGFVEYALKIGYKSDAKDFANITYQYLHSMSKKGKISKNDNNEYFLA